ncbi:MAG: DUF4386 family protein [Anaerolineae bacterium]
MNLVKVGGVCAILTVVVWVVAIIFMLASGVEEDPYKIEAYLRDAHNNAFYLSSAALVVVVMAFLIPAVLGFYQALQRAGRLLWPALAFALIGVSMVFMALMLTLGELTQLVPGYAEADAALKPALAVVESTVLVSISWMWSLGVFLSLGIGGVLFSIGVLRTSVIARWIGWLGVAAGVLMVFFPLALVWDVLVMAPFVPFVLSMAWLVAMGVSLLRLREPVASATGS